MRLGVRLPCWGVGPVVSLALAQAATLVSHGSQVSNKGTSTRRNEAEMPTGRSGTGRKEAVDSSVWGYPTHPTTQSNYT